MTKISLLTGNLEKDEIEGLNRKLRISEKQIRNLIKRIEELENENKKLKEENKDLKKRKRSEYVDDEAKVTKNKRRKIQPETIEEEESEIVPVETNEEELQKEEQQKIMKEFVMEFTKKKYVNEEIYEIQNNNEDEIEEMAKILRKQVEDKRERMKERIKLAKYFEKKVKKEMEKNPTKGVNKIKKEIYEELLGKIVGCVPSNIKLEMSRAKKILRLFRGVGEENIRYMNTKIVTASKIRELSDEQIDEVIRRVKKDLKEIVEKL